MPGRQACPNTVQSKQQQPPLGKSVQTAHFSLFPSTHTAGKKTKGLNVCSTLHLLTLRRTRTHYVRAIAAPMMSVACVLLSERAHSCLRVLAHAISFVHMCSLPQHLTLPYPPPLPPPVILPCVKTCVAALTLSALMFKATAESRRGPAHLQR